eukprot:5103874-Pleurochrysis_carterae.AAC.1
MARSGTIYQELELAVTPSEINILCFAVYFYCTHSLIAIVHLAYKESIQAASTCRSFTAPSP